MCIQHHAAVFCKQFIGICITVGCRATGYIIPCCEMIAFLAGSGQLSQIAHGQITGLDLVSAAGIEHHFMCKDFHLCPVRGLLIFQETNLQHIGAGLSQGDSQLGSAIVDGDNLTVIDLHFITGCAGNGLPVEGVAIVAQAFTHFQIAKHTHIAPSGLPCSNAANADAHLGSGAQLHRICQIQRSFHGLYLHIADLHFVLFSASNRIPAQHSADQTNIRRSSRTLLIHSQLGSCRRMVTTGLGINLNHDAAFPCIAFLQRDAGLTAHITEAVVVVSIAALHRNHIPCSIGNFVPNNALGCFVIAQALNGLQCSAIHKFTGGRRTIALSHGSYGKADAFSRHIAICKIEGSGSTVIKQGVLVFCITADHGDQILLCILNHVENQHGIDHFELAHLTQCLVDVVTNRLSIVSIAGGSQCSHADLILTFCIGIKGNIKGGSTGRLIIDNDFTVGTIHADRIRTGACDRIPVNRTGSHIDHGCCQLGAGSSALPYGEQQSVAGQLHAFLISVGQLFAIVGHADPPTHKLIAFTSDNGQTKQLATGSAHRVGIICKFIVEIKVNSILCAADQFFTPASIEGQICSYGLCIESKGSLKLAVHIPTHKNLTFADRIFGLRQRLAIKHSLRLHRTTTVGLEANGIGDLLQETHGCAIKSQRYHIVFQCSFDILNTFCAKV